MHIGVGIGVGFGRVPQAAAAFAPTDVTGLLVWVDASDEATITESGGAVSQIDDKSGNGNHLIQATGSKQPTTGLHTVNGRNAVTFDGVGEIMHTDGNPFGANVVDALVMITYKINTIANSTLFSLTGDAAAAYRWQSHCPFGDGNIYFDTDTTTGAGRVSGASGFANGEDHLVEFYGSDTEEVQELWVDGAELNSDATGHTVPTTSNGIQLGGATGVVGCACAILEMIVVNGTVSSEDRASLRSFLAARAGVTLP